MAADGSTTINAYYTRNTYTLRFLNSRGNTEITRLTRKYDAYIGDWWIANVGANSRYAENQWSWTGTAQTVYQNNMPGQNMDCKLQESSGRTRYLHYYVEDENGNIDDPKNEGRTFSEYTTTRLDFDGSLTYNEEYFPIAGYERYYSTVPGWNDRNPSNYGLKDYDTDFYFYYSATSTRWTCMALRVKRLAAIR